MTGDAVSGDRVSDDRVTGDAVLGDRVSDDRVTGDAVLGDLVSGDHKGAPLRFGGPDCSMINRIP